MSVSLVLPTFDGTREPPNSKLSEVPHGLKQCGKNLFKHPKRVRTIYPPLALPETASERDAFIARTAKVGDIPTINPVTAPATVHTEVINVEDAEASIAAIIEQEGRPNLSKPRTYHVPLNRPSFFRIIRLFIEMEQELYRREQADRNEDSSDSGDSDLAGQVIIDDKKIKRPLPSLRCSEGTTERPPADSLPEPSKIHLSSLRRDILRESLEDLERQSVKDTRSPTDNLPAHSISSRDFASSALTGASSLGHLHPPKRPHIVRFSDGTLSTGGEAGTEGSVMNAPFMPDARHSDPISVPDLMKWNRPWWERYKPWELICAVVFLAIIFGFAAAILAVWGRHEHFKHQPMPKYVPGRRLGWSGGNLTDAVAATAVRGDWKGNGGPSSTIKSTPAWEHVVPVVTLKGEGPLPAGVEEALAMTTGVPL